MSLYKYPFSIHAIILIICVFAGNYARTDEHGVEIPWATRVATHLDPFHHWFQGTRETDFPSVFPYPGSEQWDEVGASANFLEGCTYQMNADAFSSAMANIVARVESYPEEIRDDIIRETYNAGFFDGDGTLCGRVLSLLTPLTIVISLAIKGVEIPYKKLLCKNGFTFCGDDSDKVSRSLSTMDIFWFITWQEVLFIKRLQFNVMLLFGLALRLLGTFLSPLGWLVRGIVGPTLSALNKDHGALIPEEAYLQRLDRLRIEHPLLYQLYIAGLMGSDGNVGSGRVSQTKFSQSIYSFQNALAQSMQRAFGFSDVPNVYRREKPGSRQKDSFDCNFSAEQGEALTLLVGSFDYNRRAQWLLTLIMRLVVSAPDFPNKTNIREFIEDILIVIREEEPS